MTCSSLSKKIPKLSYFCAWYYRCQTDKQTLAIIPSVHKTKDSKFCTIQLITDTNAFHTQFPYDDFKKNRDEIPIGNNRFGKSGVSLDIHTPKFHVTGFSLCCNRYGDFSFVSRFAICILLLLCFSIVFPALFLVSREGEILARFEPTVAMKTVMEKVKAVL